jgi:hypothetical protein
MKDNVTASTADASGTVMRMSEPKRVPHPRPEIVGNFKVVYPIFRDDLAEAVLTPLEFCPQCGAGVGKHRRDGEGTCPVCDPKSEGAKS